AHLLIPRQQHKLVSGADNQGWAVLIDGLVNNMDGKAVTPAEIAVLFSPVIIFMILNLHFAFYGVQLRRGGNLSKLSQAMLLKRSWLEPTQGRQRCIL
ncbi:MAG: hypothetical protein ACREBU_20315, partial [Nitrososphaera sp.]